MDVEIISTEIIKPSSPTPDNLRHYQLSFLDQLSPSVYSPFLYYYALNDDINDNIIIAEISDKLKKSLSQALTLYYPLAGRFMNDNLDCNDEGVPFLEARVIETKLSDVLNNPVPNELNKLLPFKLDKTAELPLGVQLNVFACGAIAVGICISHRIADALSGLVFMRTWMAIARSGNDAAAVVRPEFVSAEIFPPKNLGRYDCAAFYLSKLSAIVTKKFLFDSSKIEVLREKYSDEESANGLRIRPSRIQAVSAFIWTHFMAATKDGSESEPQKLYTAHHAVNLRRKVDPPLSEHSFGNYYRSSTTIEPSITSTTPSPSLARKIGEDIRKIDKGFVNNFRFNINEEEFLKSLHEGLERYAKGYVVPLVFTSLCRFPLYEADFGFGNPKWVSSASRCFKNTVGFMDNKTGDGIEAYVCLSPEDMAKLEADKEFLSFTSPIIVA